ncbi:MAG: flagellar protein export ATPase FliI [Armatimonadetes bacterium]|nr:flagellar protein export ATPase FliI [Armatimonadota bacterium]
MKSPELEKYSQALSRVNAIRLNGRVSRIVGVLVESAGPAARMGEICEIYPNRYDPPMLAEVVGFNDDRVLLMPFGEIGDLGKGAEVSATGSPLQVALSDDLLGRVLDGLGRPMDGKPPVETNHFASTLREPPHPLERERITQRLALGVRAIDGLITCGTGQRVGIFAGSGVGKSTLLGMIARNTEADINVIGLIGERGREVRDFIERDLGPEGLARSVVVVATSDQVSIQRLRGAQVATTIAEYFRDQGKRVLLMLDSVTRIAWAQREIGLAAGEPPTTRGYTPSVFAMLPKLLERTGTSSRGSITGLYTVLVDGDDMNEPVADSVRSILDGHIVLSRNLAHQNHYPAVDVLASVSRVMPEITSTEHRRAAGHVRRLMAAYRDNEDLITIGAYVAGANAEVDEAIATRDAINSILRQDIHARADFDETVQQLAQVSSSDAE